MRRNTVLRMIDLGISVETPLSAAPLRILTDPDGSARKSTYPRRPPRLDVSPLESVWYAAIPTSRAVYDVPFPIGYVVGIDNIVAAGNAPTKQRPNFLANTQPALGIRAVLTRGEVTASPS